MGRATTTDSISSPSTHPPARARGGGQPVDCREKVSAVISLSVFTSKSGSSGSIARKASRTAAAQSSGAPCGRSS